MAAEARRLGLRRDGRQHGRHQPRHGAGLHARPAVRLVDLDGPTFLAEDREPGVDICGRRDLVPGRSVGRPAAVASPHEPSTRTGSASRAA